MAGTYRVRKKPSASVRLLSSFFVILVLACGAQTGTGSSRPEQKTEESGIGHIGKSEISQPEAQRHGYVRDEVLVKFKPGTDAESIERIWSTLKLETVRKFASPNLFLMKITDGSSVPSVIEQLKTYKTVKYAEPNYVVKTGP